MDDTDVFGRTTTNDASGLGHEKIHPSDIEDLERLLVVCELDHRFDRNEFLVEVDMIHRDDKELEGREHLEHHILLSDMRSCLMLRPYRYVSIKDPTPRMRDMGS